LEATTLVVIPAVGASEAFMVAVSPEVEVFTGEEEVTGKR